VAPPQLNHPLHRLHNLSPKTKSLLHLPPDLYHKARNRSRIGFTSRIIGFFYGLFVLWFILHRKFSARFRDWAERVSRNRFVQALIFTSS